MDPREARGRELARLGKLKRLGRKWSVPSQQRNAEGSAKGYLVDPEAETCTCPDAELRRAKCKHQHAVEYTILWEQTSDTDGSVSETLTIKRKTYRQDWPAYNAAQAHEQEHVEVLLRALCDGVQQPEQTMGRPRLPLADLVYGVVLKVYSGMSGRRAQTDVRNCRAKGRLSTAPSYNSIFRTFESPALTPILKMLIEESALPLREVERQFSQDSTGFSTTTYDRWCGLKHGERREHARRASVKLHAFVGTLTNVITSAKVTDTYDGKMLPPMLHETVANRFAVEEMSADKAYLTHKNLDVIHAAGAAAYIPFKDNSVGTGPKLWREAYAFFMEHRPEFLAHYHRRSNVESTMWMLKSKFGGAVRSKLPVARENEVLAKVVCHNLCALTQTFYETGIAPRFWWELWQPALSASEVSGIEE
jgi:transposase